MSTGMKVLIVVAIIVTVVAAPTQAADLIGDVFRGIMRFVGALG